MLRELKKNLLQTVGGEEIKLRKDGSVDSNIKELIILDPENDNKKLFHLVKEFSVRDGQKKYGYVLYFLDYNSGGEDGSKKFIAKFIDNNINSVMKKFHVGITDKATIIQFKHHKAGDCLKVIFKEVGEKKSRKTKKEESKVEAN